MHHQVFFFDGQGRNDMVAHRNEFLTKLDKFDKTCNSDIPVLNAEEKPLIHVVHDECTYYSNSDQTYF